MFGEDGYKINISKPIVFCASNNKVEIKMEKYVIHNSDKNYKNI